MSLSLTLAKIKWAYQGGYLWRAFQSWWPFFVAKHLPHQVTLWAYIRVHANWKEGAAAHRDFDSACKAWEQLANQHE